MTGPLRTANSGNILEIVLERPQANAIAADTSGRMGEVVSARDSPDLQVAILTGAGDRWRE